MTKPLNLNDIPSEIWENVFNNLPKCTQRECERVCKQWYLPAQRTFLQDIVLSSCYEVEKFVEYFLNYGTPTLFSSVRTFRIGSTYTPPDRARHLLETNAIEEMINHFPNILEFVISGNCINLTYFQKEGIVQSMAKHWPNLQLFRVDAGWLHPDERKIYLQTNYHLRKSIRHLIHYEHSYIIEQGGLKAYLKSFPNLIGIKVVSREVCNLLSALPIIEYSQHLTFLDLYVTREDTGCLMDHYTGDVLMLKEKVMKLKHIKISMAMFCIYTVEFMIHYLTGLSQAHISINQVNIKEWTIEQKELFKHGLLDFLCQKDTFSLRSLQVNYNQEVEFMNDVLQKLYHCIPANVKRVERHVDLKLYNNSPDVSSDYNNMYSNVGNFGFEMKSSIKDNHTLVRSAHFSHFILLEGGLRNKSLKYLQLMDTLLNDITSLTFNTYGINVLTHLLPNIFENTLQQFTNLNKVTVHLSKNSTNKCNSFVCQDITSIHPQLTHLEIIAGHALCIKQDMFPMISTCFPSLSHLQLWFHSGYYAKSEFLLQMEETQLERLCLDVTPIRVQTERLYNRCDDFILKITTEKTRKYSDQFRPVLTMDPKDLIQTTLVF